MNTDDFQHMFHVFLFIFMTLGFIISVATMFAQAERLKLLEAEIEEGKEMMKFYEDLVKKWETFSKKKQEEINHLRSNPQS